MRTLSGNYPEVWIVYDRIQTLNGETKRIYHLVENVHDVIIAVKFFKQRPPELPDGCIGKLHEVHIWHSAQESTVTDNFRFLWRTY